MFGLGLVAKLPRTFVFLFTFITVFLLVFLVLACIGTASTYSSVYLVEYTYNEGSSLYSTIRQEFHNANLTGYETLYVRAGYFSICAGTDSLPIMCASHGNLTGLNVFDKYIGLSNVTTSSSQALSINPLQLADTFSTKVINPFFLVVAIVFVLATLFLTLWTGVSPRLSPTGLVNILWAVCMGLAWLFATISAIWIHVASNSVSSLVEDASLSIMQARTGTRSAAMSWTSFAFLTVSLGLLLYSLMKQRRSIMDK